MAPIAAGGARFKAARRLTREAPRLSPETSDRPDQTASAVPPDNGDDQAYFLAIEDFFVRLRGAPLQLAPADWHVARRWHRQGIPLALVRQAIEVVFARRRERGLKPYCRLRYCAPAVEEAWAQHLELAAPGGRAAAEPLDVAARLSRLAAALPAGLPGMEELKRRLSELSRAGLDPQSLEERLADLDRAALDGALAALAAERRATLDATVAKALSALGGRLPAAEVERARERLARQVLRELTGLPMLSLFSPEALPDEPAAARVPEP
jgi:hypothetical protein